MSHSVTRRSLAVVLLMSFFCAAARGSDPKPEQEATIQPETKARLTLQSRINSKLSEVDDVVTATLSEPIYVEGALVLPRGTEFHGRIIQVAPARHGQRSSHMSINFERVITAAGAMPISAQVTAIDDWDNEETIKANGEGKLKGGHRGGQTIENIRKGSSLGFSAAIVGVALGGAAGASGRQALGIGGVGLAAGMIAGVLLTKGREIRVGAGNILRIRFLKPVKLPVIPQPGPVRGSDQ